MNMGSKLSNKSYSSKYNSQVKDSCKVISNKYAIYVVHGVRDVPGHCSYVRNIEYVVCLKNSIGWGWIKW